MRIRPKMQNWILNRQHFPGSVSDCIGHTWCQQKQTFSSSRWWWSNDRIRKLPGARDKQRRQCAALQSRSLQQKFRGKDHCLSKLFCVCVAFVLTRSFNSLKYIDTHKKKYHIYQSQDTQRTINVENICYYEGSSRFLLWLSLAICSF